MARARAIRSANSFAKLTRSQRATYQRTLDTLSGMRRGQSLTAAARHAGTTPRSVRRYAGATVKRSGSRYTLGRDRMYRQMNVLTNTGIEPVAVSRRESKTLGRYWNAVGRYLHHGDSSELSQFRGVSVGGYELETALDVIDVLAARGQLDFEDIYELAA
ncbi:MAG: hypothetical protein ACR2ND_14400 [Solirubrobacteraceae bacterium]